MSTMRALAGIFLHHSRRPTGPNVIGGEDTDDWRLIQQQMAPVRQEEVSRRYGVTKPRWHALEGGAVSEGYHKTRVRGTKYTRTKNGPRVKPCTRTGAAQATRTYGPMPNVDPHLFGGVGKDVAAMGGDGKNVAGHSNGPRIVPRGPESLVETPPRMRSPTSDIQWHGIIITAFTGRRTCVTTSLCRTSCPRHRRIRLVLRLYGARPFIGECRSWLPRNNT